MKRHLNYQSSIMKTSLMKKILLLLTLTISGISYANAQAIATVSKNNITENEVIQLMVSVDKSADQSKFDISQLGPDFRSGQVSFGSSRSLVNGDYSVQSQWTVSIAPTKMGILTIPSMEVAGEQTNPINIRVNKDATAPKSSDIIKVSGELSKNELYEGETAQFNAKIAIFADIRRLKDPNIITPKGNGVEFSPIGESKQYQTVIDGLQATVVEQVFSLSANKAGKLTFDGLAFTGGLIQTDRYGRSTKLIPLNINPKQYSINVLTKPSDYKGTWLPTSDLKLGQQWLVDGKVLTNTEVEAGTAITRQITLMMADVPPEKLPSIDISYPKSVRMYDEKPTIGKDSQGNSVMTIKQVIIPHTSGQVKLPAVSIQWWNSKTHKAEVAKLDSLTLTVTPNSQKSEQMIEQETNEQSKTVIKREVDHGIWPYSTLGFAILWLLTLIAWYKARNSVSKETLTVTSNHAISNSDISVLITALKSDNTILAHQIIQDHADGWKAKGIDTDKVKVLIEKLSHAKYSNKSENTDKERLIKEITQQLKVSNKSKLSPAELEAL
ncbi:BatD family protein [Aliivibrio fischeri]|uniref:BatD family protein n=1 Tax=Aliivibrio fischeri TaxID=668 RepID=UPI00142FE007|nr:BatD family protein [Aliivibrio fischeri]